MATSTDRYQVNLETALALTRPDGSKNLNVVRAVSNVTFNDPIGSSATITFTTPINITDVPDAKWYVGLESAFLMHTWKNISQSQGNNVLKYRVSAGAWKTVTLPDGNYNLLEFNAAVQSVIETNGDGTPSDPGITFVANGINGCTIAQIDSTFDIDLTNTGLAYLLGFDPQIVLGAAGYQESEHTANFSGGVTSVSIECSIAQGGYLNGANSQSIYCWTLEGSPNSLQDIWPSHNVNWFPVVSRGTIDSMTISLRTNTGQNWNPYGTDWGVRVLLARR